MAEDPRKEGVSASPRAAKARPKPKKAQPKKSAPKKALPKKAGPKKALPKRAGPKKAALKKAMPHKAELKKAELKKLPAKKPKPKKPKAKSWWNWFWSEASTLQKGLIGLAAALTALGVIGGYLVKGGELVRPLVSGARLTLRGTCHNNQILIEVANSGGRTARLGLPSFTIHSPERPSDVLDLRPYLKNPPVGDRVDLPSDRSHPFEYNNPLDFFNSGESAGNACHYEVAVPVEGARSLSGTCPCNYIER